MSRTPSLTIAFALSVLAAAAPTQASAADGSDASSEMAKTTNQYRTEHGVPDLTVSASLAQSAQTWADQGEFRHSDSNDFGENLYEGSSPCTTGDLSDAVKMWYAEGKKYDYQHADTAAADRQQFDDGTGHFTQVVWKGSHQVGVGMSTVKGKCLVVARYSPPGNFMGEYKENVLPPKRG